EQLGERHPEVATSLNNLADLYSDQGRYDEAEPLYHQALEIYREQFGEAHPTVATSLNNLALLYQAQNRFNEAEPLYLQSLAVFREQLGYRHPDIANSLNNLGLLYQGQGRYAEAETQHLNALDIRREQLGDRHPHTAQSLNNLAFLYSDQGRYAEAEPLYTQALEIYQEQLGERHPDVAISLRNLAELHQVNGMTDAAIAALQVSLDIEEQNLELNLATLADTQRQAYAATIADSVDYAISLHLQAAPESSAAAQLALTTVLRRKGRIQDAGTRSLQTLRQNLTSADQTTLDQLTEVRQTLARLTFNSSANLTPETYRNTLATLEAEANELEAVLARRSAVFRAESEPVELSTIQSQIPANGVLVEYVRYQPFDPVNLATPWGEPRYAAYLLLSNGRIEAVDLGEAAAIDTAVDAFSRLLQTPTVAFQPSRASLEVEYAPTADAIATAAQLRTLILEPIAAYLPDQGHLLISPDSQLNRIPFEALPAETDGRYLIEQYQLSYLNTGRDLVTFGLVSPSQAPALVLANPDYDQAPSPGSSVATGGVASQRSVDLSQFQVGP
ncbi:MAG: tetratricopeptide repeat protein, partial [Leptolyngbya sp. SIO1D8]|nr:tetratricopeptide repeat protein [Leptolyngbya sp. SIO1D8]